MKEDIIKLSIKYLKKDGLKFNLDLIAHDLKISKKTIYKYFKDKEDLALNVYSYYFDTLDTKINKIINSNNIDLIKILDLYYESLIMTREDMFNKFNLNSSCLNYINSRNISTFNLISPLFNLNNEEEIDIYKTIIDGTIKLSIKENKNKALIIKELKNLLWKSL